MLNTQKYISENALPLYWFDQPNSTKEYKIYNDGSHYVATLCRQSVLKTKQVHCSRNNIDKYFDQLHYVALQQNLRGVAKENYLANNLFDYFDTVENTYTYVRKQLKRKWHNLHNRKKRFCRKAYLNNWNYFITITYDDKKMSADEFRRKLRKCLSNFHTRRAWRYMGVFEKAPNTGRLHFHALVYIPNGEMVGSIELQKDYSHATHDMQETHINTFFARQFGRNDFEELNEMELKKGNTLEYLLKYIGKTDERIIYSRGIPTEITLKVKNIDIACRFIDYIEKFVLHDNVIDWKRDIARFKYKQLSLVS